METKAEVCNILNINTEAISDTYFNQMPSYPDLCIHDVVLTACWYIWWMRRQVTHEGAVPPVNKCALSILAITSNYSKSSAKVTSVVKEKWV